MNDLRRVELSRKHASRFRKLAADMNRLLADIREEIPRANLYLEDSGNWILLSDDSHDEKGRARHDRKLAFEIVPHSGGGGW